MFTFWANPDMQILEERLALWDGAEECAVFESGMAAIATVLFEFLKPGDLLLYSNPLYGGTDHFVHHLLPKFGINVLGFHPRSTEQDIEALLLENGISDNLVRLSVGVEHVEDLWWDLEQALDNVKPVKPETARLEKVEAFEAAG